MKPRIHNPVTSFVAAAFCLFALAIAPVRAAEVANTILGTDGPRFILNGRPTFLLGFSYYAGLGASDGSVRQDLDQFQRHGFNWLRVWATWAGFGNNIAAVDTNGHPREPFLGRLRSLVAEADRRGMVVDVTLHRGKELPSFEAHRQAVETLVASLQQHRNWFLDLANEHDVGDARHVGVEELKLLRQRVRELDPRRLVTASFGGHDLSLDDIRNSVLTVGEDLLAPHRPRDAGSPADTEAKTRETLAMMKQFGRTVPVLYQEPFRRGYTDWQPTAADFRTDLSGARTGGAAGWCFHNGATRGVSGERPRRSFDLREKRLFDQLDAEERAFVLAPDK